MGFSQKTQIDGGSVAELEGKKWVVAGISVRTPLKPISTNKIERGSNSSNEEEEFSTTPTAEGMKIPEKLPCPPPPRKRRPSLKCNLNGAREFFSPPDLETVFTFRV
ncbi:Cyclin-dependent protein kinase inhibitor smr6 [Thalictrum thalictroides]|uniref:Cyclin-dependent protein kinase inhibitor smr6 n=1 Tax=Thalictrum thalictroides TaxID=46969 RepID=A0A7J6WPI2_THATH|nr:Cyclin-dependent protein kinase inhibitor smr6 [Thalictrum thalictroides]